MSFAATVVLLSTILSVPLSTAIFRLQGDINLGVFLPLHGFADGISCSKNLSRSLFQLGQSVKWAIEQVNQSPHLLPNITLGYVYLDTCWKETQSLYRALHNIQPLWRNDGMMPIAPPSEHQTAIVGAIGGMRSSTAVVLSQFLQLYQIPLISPNANDAILSDKMKHPYFARILPTARVAGRMMARLLNRFNWRYVAVLYDSSAVGFQFYEGFAELKEEFGICDPIATSLSLVTDTKRIYDTVDKIIRYRNISVIIVYTKYIVSQKILRYIRVTTNKTYVYLFYDNFISGKGYRPMTTSSLYTMFSSAPVEAFQKIFSSFNLNKGVSHKPIRISLTEGFFKCNYNTTCKKFQNSTLKESNRYIPDYRVSMFLDIVNVYAHALHNLIANKCPLAFRNTSILATCITGPQLYNQILNITLLSADTCNGHITFANNTGDGFINIKIRQMQQLPNGDFIQRSIGLYHTREDRLALNDSSLIWSTTEDSTSVPVSLCGFPCKGNTIPLVETELCCWKCKPCAPNEILIANRTNCQSCPSLHWPDQIRFEVCTRLVVKYNRFSDKTGFVFIAITSFSVLFNLVIIILLWRHRCDKVLKASNFYPTLLLAICTLLEFACVYLFFERPNQARCHIIPIISHLLGTITYVTLFIKSLRIFRIFRASDQMKMSLKYMSNGAQFLQIGFFVTLQIIIVTVNSLIVGLSTDSIFMPNKFTPIVYHICRQSHPQFIGPFLFNILILLATLVLAFYTRKLPDNFKESFCLLICACVNLSLWVCFLPAHFLIDESPSKDFLFIIAGLIHAYSVLAFFCCSRIIAVYMPQSSQQMSSTRSAATGNRFNGSKFVGQSRITEQDTVLLPLQQQ